MDTPSDKRVVVLSLNTPTPTDKEPDASPTRPEEASATAVIWLLPREAIVKLSAADRLAVPPISVRAIFSVTEIAPTKDTPIELACVYIVD